MRGTLPNRSKIFTKVGPRSSDLGVCEQYKAWTSRLDSQNGLARHSGFLFDNEERHDFFFPLQCFDFQKMSQYRSFGACSFIPAPCNALIATGNSHPASRIPNRRGVGVPEEHEHAVMSSNTHELAQSTTTLWCSPRSPSTKSARPKYSTLINRKRVQRRFSSPIPTLGPQLVPATFH